MGLNTTVLVLNDNLADIEKDEKLGSLLATCIKQMHNPERWLSPVGHGVYVVETHHADDVAILAVGGNTARVVGFLPTLHAVLADDTDFAANITRLLQAKFLPVKPTPRLDEMKALRKHAKRTDFSNLPKETEDPALTEASVEELNNEAKRRGFRLIALRRKGEDAPRLTTKKARKA